jgi:hypothetical protein
MSWNDPAVQERWSTALAVRPRLFEAPPGPTADVALAGLRRTLVELSPEVGDERVNGAWHGIRDGLVVRGRRAGRTAVAACRPRHERRGRGAHGYASPSLPLSRNGSVLSVNLVVPHCQTNYQRHLLETDAAIVVWATAEPHGLEASSRPGGSSPSPCASPSVTGR